MAKQPSSTSSGTSPRTILFAAVGVVAVVAIGFAAFGLDSDTNVSVEEVAGSPEIDGEALPPLTDPATDPTVGSPAPVVTGADFDGQATSIGDGDAEIVVFLASWCPACRAELPELVQWLDDGGLPEGVRFTAVSTSLDPNAGNWPPQAWLEREGYDQPVLVDDAAGSVATAYGMSGTPFTVALRDGEVVARTSGQVPMDAMSQLASSLVG